MLETLGLVIYASLFVVLGLKHLRNHQAMVGYTASSLGDCPVKDQVAFLGGAPTGAFLVVVGVAAALSQVWAFYALAAFLTVVTLTFHRNFLTDPGGFKGVALIGSSLALATLL